MKNSIIHNKLFYMFKKKKKKKKNFDLPSNNLCKHA